MSEKIVSVEVPWKEITVVILNPNGWPQAENVRTVRACRWLASVKGINNLLHHSLTISDVLTSPGTPNFINLDYTSAESIYLPSGLRVGDHGILHLANGPDSCKPKVVLEYAPDRTGIKGEIIHQEIARQCAYCSCEAVSYLCKGDHSFVIDYGQIPVCGKCEQDIPKHKEK